MQTAELSTSAARNPQPKPGYPGSMERERVLRTLSAVAKPVTMLYLTRVTALSKHDLEAALRGLLKDRRVTCQGHGAGKQWGLPAAALHHLSLRASVSTVSTGAAA